ncbi:MAG: phage antirepressor KilAC domain-containing protein [Methylorubrum populi]
MVHRWRCCNVPRARDRQDLIRSLDDDEKGRHSVPTLGGEQDVSVISEAGLYRAILQRRATSTVPAETREFIARFQRWVFHDVLPAIRKTGSYSVPSAPAIDVRDIGQLSKIALQLIEVNQELEHRAVAAEEKAAQAEAKIEADKPKTSFFDRFMNADGVYGLQNAGRILIEPPNKFIGWLKQQFLFYQGGDLVPRAQYRTMGIFEVKVTMVDDKARHRTYVTPKGLKYLAKKLGKDIPGLEGA